MGCGEGEAQCSELPGLWTPPHIRIVRRAGLAWGTCARAGQGKVSSSRRRPTSIHLAPSCTFGSRFPDSGATVFPARRSFKLPCFSPRVVTGYPIPQQHDPIINNSFLDPPLPRAPSGTLAAAAAADPF